MSANNLAKTLVIVGLNRDSALQEVLDDAATQGDNALITDLDGRLSKGFYSHGCKHEILDLFGPCSKTWNHLEEIGNRQDVYWMSYFPLCRVWHNITDKKWWDASYGFFADVTHAVWNVHRRWKPMTVQEFHRVLTQAPVADGRLTTRRKLRKWFRKRLLKVARRWDLLAELEKLLLPLEDLNEWLYGSESEKLLSTHAKTLGSVRAIVGFELRSFFFLPHAGLPPGLENLSIREWVEKSPERKNAGTGNFLFLPFILQEIAMMRPLFSIWLYTAIKAAVRMKPSQDRCLRLILDGIDHFAPIQALGEIAVHLRKSGCVQLILGIRDLDRFKEQYGEDAEAILDGAEIRYV